MNLIKQIGNLFSTGTSFSNYYRNLNLYLKENFKPGVMTGIDLEEENIVIAHSEKKRRCLENIFFFVSDAQNMTVIENQSVDVVINIESAFHYPDKVKFLKEIYRVLKPGASFLIADLLTTKNKGTGIRRSWKKRMILNHWHKNQYDSGISEAKLGLTHYEEI